MKTIFEASTGLEAHMVLNLLEQAGISGRIEGEYLQGGIGELQALNLVRVRVAERDYEAARSILAEWEATQPEAGAQHSRPAGVAGAGLGFLLGLAAGAAGVYWLYHTPVSEDGIDYDRDGRLDEKRLYVDERLAQIEIDRNGDGRADLVHRLDRLGLRERSDADDDFDGVFETRLTYVDGKPALGESDVDGDGAVDFRGRFRDGVLRESEILAPDTGRVRKRQRYHLGKRVAWEYDGDGDGRPDVFGEYDFYEEPRGAARGLP